MQTYNAINISHTLTQLKLKNAKIIIDATAGNGKDTLFLAKNSLPEAIVWAFDIQEQALETTKQLLNNEGLLHKVTLVLDSHENITNYHFGKADIIMFNLGYLPGSGNKIMTLPETTLSALKQSIKLLAVGGIISLIAYPGHELGKIEYQIISKYLYSLPAKFFTVGSWSMVNHVNNPPVAFVVEKVRGD